MATPAPAAAPAPAPVAADPRMRAQDPRTAAASTSLPDPRSQIAAPDPRSQPVSLEQHVVDPRNTPHHNQPPSVPVQRPVPELNGKFTRPMDFRLIPVYVEIRTSYIPPGAENSQEMLRDPRIKKRVLSRKDEIAPVLPSLPDITADLQRIQNARLSAQNIPAATTSRQASRASVDSISDPRRSSIDRLPSRGQGDQNSNTESILENGTKARNATRTALSRVNPMSSGANYGSNSSAYDEDDEDENNSLTIDMPDDDTKSSTKAMETACT